MCTDESNLTAPLGKNYELAIALLCSADGTLEKVLWEHKLTLFDLAPGDSLISLLHNDNLTTFFELFSEAKARSYAFGRALIFVTGKTEKMFHLWAVPTKDSFIVFLMDSYQHFPEILDGIKTQSFSHYKIALNALEQISRSESGNPSVVDSLMRTNHELIDLLRNASKKNSELQTSLTRLQTINRSIDQFAGTISHDLKAPVASVIMHLDYIESELKSGKSDKLDLMLKRAHKSALRASTMISTILAHSRQLSLNPVLESISVEPLIEEILSDLAMVLKNSETTVQTSPMPSVLADKNLLLHILQNLLQNAIKYRTSERTPFIRIEHKITVDFIEIHVKDNGIGIAEDKMETIFEPFMQLQEGSEGHGLGLAICKFFTEKMGGTIRVESQEGVGSNFIVALKRSF